MKLTMAECQRLGFESEHVAEADIEAGAKQNLHRYLSRHPKLRSAYRRGVLLRYLVDLGPNALIYEAATRLRELGFDRFDSAQALRDFLDSDSEANELWETARVNAFIRNRQSLRETANEGNVQAIKLLDKWAVDRQRETGEPGVNFNRVAMSKMAELFNTTRQTIHDWYTTKGLPQNTDGTFDLHRAIPWCEEFVLKKAVRGKDAVDPLNPFQRVKTEREKLRLDQDRGELIERGAVVAWVTAMMQNIVNAFNSIADLANRVFGQPREDIVGHLEDFRDEVMAKLQHVPPELKLSDQALAKLTEFHEMLKPQSTQSDTGDQKNGS